MGICQTCGGVNGQSAARIVEDINTGAPNPWACVCPGHDEPTNLADYAAKKGNPWLGLGNLLSGSQEKPKHDGKLDDYSVSYADPIYTVFGPTEGIRIKCHGGPEQADLTYEQALSLLSWLQQEKPTLEKMVGVEKGTSKE